MRARSLPFGFALGRVFPSGAKARVIGGSKRPGWRLAHSKPRADFQTTNDHRL